MIVQTVRAGAVGIALWGTALAADSPGRDLAGVMRLGDVLVAMRNEGLADARALDAEMLGGRGGAYWMTEVRRIYDVGRMTDAMIAAMDRGMTQTQAATALDFFRSGAGRRIVTMEVAARVAMSDPELEAVSQEMYQALLAQRDPVLTSVDGFIRTNDLIGRNVTGAMASSYAFYRGMIDGGAPGLDEQGILANLRARRDAIEQETRDWLHGFLSMAFSALSTTDRAAYASFSEGDSGQALNDALFDGFDAMYLEISFELGRALGQNLSASDL